MSTTLYLECSSGISGDMTVAALLDLGASERHLREALATLPVANEFSVAVSHVHKNGIAAVDFDVELDAAHETHDHDMAWLYGTGDAAPAMHEHEHAEHGHERMAGPTAHHDHEHDHEHCGHGQEHVGHHHAHRSLADVTAIIDGSGLSARAKELAHAVFRKLAEAEAAAHGATPETVHFHEVGATDSIADICSVAICLDDLDVSRVIVPSLAEGHGTVRCAHGVMPVPVPAVTHLCQTAAIELEPAPVHGELVTPTGAAIVAALRTDTQPPARYLITAVGYGAGKRPYENCSGLLRASLIEETVGGATVESAAPATDTAPTGTTASPTPRGTSEPATSGLAVTKLETDIDDCTGEALGRVIELLMAAGARDAHAIPVVMKKGRPGYQLEVVCDALDVEALEHIVFENTTTIGIRSVTMRRDALARTPGEAATPFGPIATKRVVLPDGSVRTYPEYDSVVAACERTGASFQDVFRKTQAADDTTQTVGDAAVHAVSPRA